MSSELIIVKYFRSKTATKVYVQSNTLHRQLFDLFTDGNTCKEYFRSDNVHRNSYRYHLLFPSPMAKFPNGVATPSPIPSPIPKPPI